MHETWDYSPIDVPDHARIGKINAGDNVLQVGTGTGYTTALRYERLGSNKVTTFDIDPDLSNDARTGLDHVGYTPIVVTGNGAQGYAPNAPNDAILATCALRRIPADGLAQATPGARIVAPLATGLIALDVTAPDQASGRFLAPGGFFMFLRDTNQQGKPTTPSHGTRRDPRPTELGPLQTFYEDQLRFPLTVALPDVSTSQHGPSWEDFTISDSAGSTTRLDRTENGAFLVTETGPRALWKKSNTFTNSGKPGANPVANATDLSSTEKARQTGSTKHATPTWHLPS